jgi:hypothetical protein
MLSTYVGTLRVVALLAALAEDGWVVCIVLSGQPNRCRNGSVACYSASSTIATIWSPSIEFVSAPIIIHLDPSHIRTFCTYRTRRRYWNSAYRIRQNIRMIEIPDMTEKDHIILLISDHT